MCLNRLFKRIAVCAWLYIEQAEGRVAGYLVNLKRFVKFGNLQQILNIQDGERQAYLVVELNCQRDGLVQFWKKAPRLHHGCTYGKCSQLNMEAVRSMKKIEGHGR